MANMKEDDYRTLAGFRYALREFVRYSESAAQEAGITTRLARCRWKFTRPRR